MIKKYEYVVKQLEKEIFDKVYDKSKKLPTEDELMKRFGVSRNTIRKSIEILSSHGYIYQVQGSGVFLRYISNPDFMMIKDIGDLKSRQQHNISKKLLELSIKEADEDIANKMKCRLGTKIYFVKRLCFRDDVPIEIEESFYNKEIIPYLNEEICNSSIFKYIREDLNLKIGFANRLISSDKLNKDEAKLLGLEENDPVLIFDNTVYLNNESIFVISRNKYNYKETKVLSLVSL